MDELMLIKNEIQFLILKVPAYVRQFRTSLLNSPQKGNVGFWELKPFSPHCVKERVTKRDKPRETHSVFNHCAILAKYIKGC